MAASAGVTSRAAATTSKDVAPPAAAARLHAYIRTDLAAVILAMASLVIIRWIFLPGESVWIVMACLAGFAVVLVHADHLVSGGHHESAVIAVAVGNWAVTIAAAALVPYALIYLPVVMLFPTLLAVPYLDSDKLTQIQGATVIAVLALAAVGVLGPGVGLESHVPEWLLDLLIVIFVPVLTGLACVLAWHSHLALAARTRAARTSAARLVAAADGERRRIERDLHDGAQQRLVGLAMQLQVARRLLGSSPVETGELIGRLATDAQAASAELRDLSHGIYPPQLTEQGLPAALRATVLGLPIAVTLRCDGVGRYPAEVESAVYFSCVEGLQNAMKHAGPGAKATLTLTSNGGLSFDLRDDGAGCELATALDGQGLRNIRDRIGAIGGTLTVDARPGHGVNLHGDAPTTGE